MGSAYETLARESAGKTFDLCAEDWAPQFDALVGEVQKVATIEVTLKTKDMTLTKVLVDGKELAHGEYQRNGDTLSLPVSEEAGEKIRVEVTYAVGE